MLCHGGGRSTSWKPTMDSCRFERCPLGSNLSARRPPPARIDSIRAANPLETLTYPRGICHTLMPKLSQHPPKEYPTQRHFFGALRMCVVYYQRAPLTRPYDLAVWCQDTPDILEHGIWRFPTMPAHTPALALRSTLAYWHYYRVHVDSPLLCFPPCISFIVVTCSNSRTPPFARPCTWKLRRSVLSLCTVHCSSSTFTRCSNHQLHFSIYAWAIASGAGRATLGLGCA